jgi:hypothetical protein
MSNYINAIKISNLFQGNQLEELKYWLDNETPHSSGWNESPDKTHMVKLCEELNTYHKVLTDKSRETFEIHNLLPTFATLSWYEAGVEKSPHIDTGPAQYTILYNYFSEFPLKLSYGDDEILLQNEEAVAYYGGDVKHSVESVDGISIRLHFNFATPDNYYFILGNSTKNGFEFPSGRLENEVEQNWL